MDTSVFNLSTGPSALERLTFEQQERLGELLDRYLAALEDGLPLCPESLYAEHPDLAEALETYLTRVDELHDMAGGFRHSATPLPDRGSASAADAERTLGDFVLIREIGRGGMGVVYEARQISLGRRVALKVLPFAAVLDRRQIARFNNEAQAAAQLQHPNIVPVFAVGAERGVHYYAMQFVDGQPLDRVIEELRGKPPLEPIDARATDVVLSHMNDTLPTEAACTSTCCSPLTRKSGNLREYFRTVVGLGIQAAEALHAAHEDGVVHRDIKPSNLLLDGGGKLWVTDFGLARCQRAETSLTKSGDMVGTLRYMSPEQTAGQSALIDHRTDIYSLGATLYELLTLQAAFPGHDGPELLRQIAHQEPERPARWQPQLPADLETVVLKAMAKSRDERYATAQQLADDLRCVLDGKPTLAKPPSSFDRLGKWARRHQRIVASVAAACLIAVLGLGVSTLMIGREKHRAELNFERAELNYRHARGIVDRFGARLAERLVEIPGAEQIRRELLQDTLQYYQDLAAQARDDPALRVDLATTYGKMGAIIENIGSTEEAIAAYESARELWDQLAAEAPRESDHRRKLALTLNHLAMLYARTGSTDDAFRAYRDAIRLQHRMVTGLSDADLHRGDLALTHNNLGLLQRETGRFAEAEASFREAIRVQQDLVDAGPEDAEQLRSLAASYNNLASLFAQDRPEQAIEFYQPAVSFQERSGTLRTGSLAHRSELALLYNNLATAHSRAGRFGEAALSYDRAVEIQSQLVEAAPAHKSYCHDLAVSHNNLGMLQSERGQTEDAGGSFQQALQFQMRLVGQHPQDVDLLSSLGGIYNNLGMVLETQHRLEEAATVYEKSVQCQQAAMAGAPSVARYRSFLSKHYHNYGRVLRQLGRPGQAAQAALARQELWPDDPDRLLAVAQELALASQLFVEQDGGGIEAQQCAAWSLQALREAVAAGLDITQDLTRLEAFAVLRDHPDFPAIIQR
ncbi:MAG: tetratricopeptide repeat protein [Pirellulaceae bacterium]|nr:tetratricopeptide repeat protein [Pirellulaceae bacterium]